VIAYDLIVTASHRPHLLEPTLVSLLDKVDQRPARLLVHDDAAVVPHERTWAQSEVFHIQAARREQARTVLQRLGVPVVYTWANPPRCLGLALRWLLNHVETDYVLYSQDDFVTLRPLPIQRALQAMDVNGLHQIRFNKRATRSEKDTWQGVWKKEEVILPGGATVTTSDHWYFQTGLWRVAPIQAALDWLTSTPERQQILSVASGEEAINRVMDGAFGAIPGLPTPEWEKAENARVRARVQRTFIWGPIGEDRYIRHIGGESPTGNHVRLGGIDTQAQAGAESRAYDVCVHCGHSAHGAPPCAACRAGGACLVEP
jgi:hypothetical protein